MALEETLDWYIAPTASHSARHVVEVNSFGGENKVPSRHRSAALASHGALGTRVIRAIEQSAAIPAAAASAQSPSSTRHRARARSGCKPRDTSNGCDRQPRTFPSRSHGPVKCALVPNSVAAPMMNGEGEVVVGVAMML